MKKSKPARTLSTCLAVLAIFSGLIAGCEGADEPTPAYIQINDFVVQPTDPNLHGSISHKITHATVFLVDKNNTSASPHQLGTVTLPVIVPALVVGEYEINIDPVIKANGNSLSLAVYPFYARYKTDLTLTSNGDVTVNPRTSYLPEAKFLMVENFEGNAHQFQTDRDGNANTFIELTQEDVFEGNQSGRVKLDTANNVFVVTHAQPFDLVLPDVGRIYLEVNYKTDVPLEFGVLAINSLNDETPYIEFVVLPKDEWNKIYFDYTTLISQIFEDRFVFIIRGGLPIENGKFTMDEAQVHFDNIKLITF